VQRIVPDVRSETSVSHCDLGAMLLPSCYPGSCNANDTFSLYGLGRIRFEVTGAPPV